MKSRAVIVPLTQTARSRAEQTFGLIKSCVPGVFLTYSGGAKTSANTTLAGLRATAIRSLGLAVVVFSVVCWPVAQLHANESETGGVAEQVVLPVDSGAVNINTASAETIAEALSGIGLVKARAIVEYRNIHGEFLHVDELQDVPGIGEVTLARIKHLLRLAVPGNTATEQVGGQSEPRT